MKKKIIFYVVQIFYKVKLVKLLVWSSDFFKLIGLKRIALKLLLSVALVYQTNKKYDESINLYLNIKNNYQKAYKKIGDLYNKQGNWKKSVEYYNIYLECIPSDYQKKNLVKYLQDIIKFEKNLERTGNWKKALSFNIRFNNNKSLISRVSELLAEAIKLKPDSADIELIKSSDLQLVSELNEIGNTTDEIINLFPFWLSTYRTLFFNGLLSSAYTAKKFAALSCVDDRNDFKYSSTRAQFWNISSHLFLKNENIAIENLKFIIESAKTENDRIFGLKLLAQLMIGKSQQNYWNEIYNKTKNVYYPNLFIDLIQDKSIAFVGPADTPLESGEEIDSFDVVIRPNISLQLNNAEYTRKYGSRSDIVYVNIINDRVNGELIKHSLSDNGCKFVVVRNNVMVDQYRKYLPARLDTPTVIHEFFQPLALLRIISDIMPLSPKKIKIFGVDFFAGKQFYNKNYISENSKLKFKRESFFQLAVDDPLMSQMIAQKWLNESKIEMDRVVESVINQSTEKYLDLLSENMIIASLSFLDQQGE